MPTPNDKELYDKVKQYIVKQYPNNSAYRSGLLVQKYKDEYYKKHKNYNAYSGTKSTSNLKRWFEEKWRSDTGQIGYTSKSSVYRPTIIVNSKTPISFQELSKKQIEKAKREKAQSGRVKNFAKL